MAAATGCRAVLGTALLDHPAMAAGAVAMIRFPQGWLALILLPQMTRLAADFLAFDVHQLAGLLVPRMVTEPATPIGQRRNVIFMRKTHSRSSQLAVNITVFQDILILLGHRTCADDYTRPDKADDDEPGNSVFLHIMPQR